MFKVLIADDEPIHLRGLSKMMVRLRPDYEIISLKNGADAYEYIKNNRIDILVTDIEMPIMNGLQLIEKIVSDGRNIKIIILSVFSSFDYAQKAISLGTMDYILKPVEEAKVHEVLKRAEDKILIEIKEKEERTKLRNQLDNALPECQEYKLNKLVYGNIKTTEYYDFPFALTEYTYGTVIVFDMKKCRSFNDEEIKEEDIKIDINNLLNCLGNSITFFLHGESGKMVTILLIKQEHMLIVSELNDALLKIIDLMKERYDINVSIGIGRIIKSFPEEVSSSFHSAIRALDAAFFSGEGSILSYEMTNTSCVYKMADYEKLEKIAMHVLSQDNENIMHSLNSLFEESLNDGYPIAEIYKRCVMQALEDVIDIIEEKIKLSDTVKLKAEAVKRIYQAFDFKAVKESVAGLIMEIYYDIENMKNNKNTKIIEECRKYIEEHYMEDLSLESAAGEFYFNPSYFSNLFKTYTDINFSEYLLRVRMANAKDMLLKTNLKVYEISKNVGYQDPKYFNRLFKKEFGLTPDEYRRTPIHRISYCIKKIL